MRCFAQVEDICLFSEVLEAAGDQRLFELGQFLALLRLHLRAGLIQRC